MGSSFYIDGFNLYYGAVRDTPYRWLDLGKLCDALSPDLRVDKIWYFTARVGDRGPSSSAVVNQNTYLDALATVPNLEAVFGKFQTKPVRLPLANPTADAQFAKVLRTEEKGSDVNLAVYLLRDAFQGICDEAVVISADSDLCSAIETVRDYTSTSIRVVFPTRRFSKAIDALGVRIGKIHESTLKKCQFPDVVCRGQRSLTKPEAWGELASGESPAPGHTTPPTPPANPPTPSPQ